MNRTDAGARAVSFECVARGRGRCCHRPRCTCDAARDTTSPPSSPTLRGGKGRAAPRRPLARVFRIVHRVLRSSVLCFPVDGGELRASWRPGGGSATTWAVGRGPPQPLNLPLQPGPRPAAAAALRGPRGGPCQKGKKGWGTASEAGRRRRRDRHALARHRSAQSAQETDRGSQWRHGHVPQKKKCPKIKEVRVYIFLITEKNFFRCKSLTKLEHLVAPELPSASAPAKPSPPCPGPRGDGARGTDRPLRCIELSVCSTRPTREVQWCASSWHS